MTTLNTEVRIQNRSGTSNYFTSKLTDFCTNSGPIDVVTDQRVIYDPFCARWITTAKHRTIFSASIRLLIGVSMTSDPTGLWNRRQVSIDDTDGPDHPVVGFNKDWIVVTMNLRPTNGPTYSRIYVFDKGGLYASNARFHIFGLTNRAYRIETSTNLSSTTNWYPIYTNTVSYW